MELSSAWSQGADEVPKVVSIRGFGTLGYATSTNNKAEFVRDLSQKDGVADSGGWHVDSMLGMQANFRATQALELVVQGVSHQRYDGSFRPELTWAFVKYELTPRVAVRVGRIGTEFLMESDSRMVGYAYLPVRPSVNFYGGVPINYGDGADLQVRMPLGEGILSGGLYMGQAREKLPTYDVSGSSIQTLSLGYEWDAWKWRYTRANSKLHHDVPQLDLLRNNLAAAGATAAANALAVAGTTSNYDSLGMAYDDGRWQAWVAFNWVVHTALINENSKGVNLMLARRVGTLSPYIGYSSVRSASKSFDSELTGPRASELKLGIASALTKGHNDQHTTSLGVRWDFMRNMDLKFQVNTVRGDPSSTPLYRNIQAGWDGNTTVYSVAMDFVF